jgi:hypothetical protein
VALSGGRQVLLECCNGRIAVLGQSTMPHEHSALTLHPLHRGVADGVARGRQPLAANLAAVGLWTDNSVRVLSLVSDAIASVAYSSLLLR